MTAPHAPDAGEGARTPLVECQTCGLSFASFAEALDHSDPMGHLLVLRAMPTPAVSEQRTGEGTEPLFGTHIREAIGILRGSARTGEETAPGVAHTTYTGIAGRLTTDDVRPRTTADYLAAAAPSERGEESALRSDARLRGALADLAAARSDIERGAEAHALGCIHSAVNAIRAEIAALASQGGEG